MDDINDSTAIVARREIRELIFSLETVLEEVGDEGGITVAELRQSLLNTIADIKEHSRISLVDSVRNRAQQVGHVMKSIDGFAHPLSVDGRVAWHRTGLVHALIVYAARLLTSSVQTLKLCREQLQTSC